MKGMKVAFRMNTGCHTSCLLIAAAITLALHEYESDRGLISLPSRLFPRYRRSSTIRRRTSFEFITHHLSDDEFKREFPLSRTAFTKLLFLLNPFLSRDEVQAARSSGGVVEPDVRLGITLRILAGGQYHDQLFSWKIGWSTAFSIFHETIAYVNKTLYMPGTPLRDEQALKAQSDLFVNSRSTSNPLHGCAGALDGIAIKICKPPD